MDHRNTYLEFTQPASPMRVQGHRSSYECVSLLWNTGMSWLQRLSTLHCKVVINTPFAWFLWPEYLTERRMSVNIWLFGFCVSLASIIVLRMIVVEENYSYLNVHIWNCVRESVTLGKIPTIFLRVVRSEFFCARSHESYWKIKRGKHHLSTW